MSASLGRGHERFPEYDIGDDADVAGVTARSVAGGHWAPAGITASHVTVEHGQEPGQRSCSYSQLYRVARRISQRPLRDIVEMAMEP